MGRPWAVLFLGIITLCAATPPPAAAESDANAVTERIDALMVEAWRAEGLQPVETASDTEFVRRVYLDLTGCVPRISETQDFLQNKLPDRRARLIDELLKRPGHAKHMANVWARILLPEESGFADFISQEALRFWLKQVFWDGRGFDAIASELLCATSDRDEGPTHFYRQGPVTPAALAGSVTNSLLGIQLSCAECHDHPFADWKREDFWGIAAFFSEVRWVERRTTRAVSSHLEDFDGPELVIPGTQQVAPLRFLNGDVIADPEGQTRRQVLATWFVSAKNPYFARSTVNRAWTMLFGEPLVESFDGNQVGRADVRVAILDELTTHFVASRFDTRELLRIMANTRAYQTTSKSPGKTTLDGRFHRMRIKPLNSDQLHQSLSSVIEQPYNVGAPVGWGLLIDLEKGAFLRRMESGAAGPGYQGEVHQALTLLNGERIAAASDWKRSPLLKSLLESKFDDSECVANLFLAAVSRRPTQTEQMRCVAHLGAGGTIATRGQALADVLWALLNSAEFALNH